MNVLSRLVTRKEIHPLTEKLFLEQILELCSKYPNQHNPVDDEGVAFYEANQATMDWSPSGCAKYCLIAQWCVDYAGIKEFPKEPMPADRFLAGKYDESMLSLIRMIQDIGDTPVIGQIRPPLWKNLTNLIKNRFEPELNREE